MICGAVISDNNTDGIGWGCMANVVKPTMEEILAVKALAMTLKDNTYHKQIGNSTNAYNEEDEE